MRVFWDGKVHKTSTAKYASTNNYVLNRKSTSKNMIVRCTAGIVSVAMAIAVVSVFDSDVAPTQAHAAPGTPGIPRSGTVVFQEDFQNTDTRVSLSAYKGADNQTYTAEYSWLPSARACNGWVYNPGSTTPSASEDGGCVANGAWAYVKGMAQVLGLAQGQSVEDSLENFALGEYTNSPDPQSKGMMLKSTDAIAVATEKHFYSVSAYFAAANCTVAQTYKAQLSLSLIVNGTLKELASNLDPCTTSMPGFNPKTNGDDYRGPNVWVTPLYSGAIKLDDRAKLGIRLDNMMGYGKGNDVAFDLPQIIDVTPQLDQTFVPSVVQIGHTTQLTYTITNTAELQAKKGWSFASSLPAWVMAAKNGDPVNSCDGGKVSLTADGSLKASGNLKVNQESCTVTVPVQVNEHGTYDVPATVVTDLDGLLPPAEGSMTTAQLVLEASVSPTSTSEAGDPIDYIFTVTNAGTVNVSNLVINAPAGYISATEPGFSGTGAWQVTCDTNTLAPKAYTTCRAPYVVTEKDFEASQLRLSATASASAKGAGEDIVSNVVEGTVRTNAPVVLRPSSTHSELSVDPTVQTVGGPVAAKAIVRDPKDVVVPGTVVTITLNGNATFGDPSAAQKASTTCTTDFTGVCEVSFTSKTAETIEVRASVDQDGKPVEIRGSGVEVRFVAGTADPGHSTLSVEPSVQKAGQPVVAMVTAMDAYGNLVDGAMVILGLDGTATFGRIGDARIGETSCMTQDGTCQVTLTDYRVGNVTVTAKIDSAAVKGSPKTIRFTTGDPSVGPVVCPDPNQKGTNLSVDLTELTVGGTSTATALITDMYCNPIKDAKVDFRIEAGTKAVLDIDNPFTDEKGNAYARVTDKAPDVVPLSAALDGKDIDGSPQLIHFVIGGVDDLYSTVEVSDAVQTVGVPVTVTVTVRDTQNNPIMGLTGADVAVRGQGQGTPDLEMANFTEQAEGVYTYTTTSKLVGDFEISAVVRGVTLSEKPHVRFIAGGVCVNNCESVDANNRTRFEMVDNSRTADGVSRNSARAWAYDTYGNPVKDATVVVEDKTTGTLTGFLQPRTQEEKTGDDGTAMVYWTSTKAGTFTAVGSIDKLDPEGRVMNQIYFVTGKADPSTSELAITPDSPLAVGAAYTAEVIVRDVNGNPVEDQMVSFRLDPVSPASLDDAQCSTDSQGRCSVQVTSKLVTRVDVHAALTVGDKQVDLRGNGDARKASPQPVEFTADTICVVDCTPVVSGHVTRVEVVTDGAEANGGAPDVALAFAFDRYGNPVKDAIVTSTGQDMTIGTVNPTAKDGTTLIEYRSTKAGAHPAQVQIAGKTPATAASMDGTTTTDGSITLNFASGTADAAHSTLSIEPRVSQVVGSTFTVTAHVQDVNGNAVEGAVVTFPEVSNLTFAKGTSCKSGPDGICDVMVTSKLVGTYTISGRIGAQPLANTVNAEFTVGSVCVQDCHPVDGGNVTRVEVTLDGREADGVQRDVVTAYGFDYYGNPVVDAVVQSVPAAGETSLTVQSDVARLDKAGRTTIWYTSTVKGPHTADVWITELTPEGSPVTVSFGNGSGSTTTSSWVIAPHGPLTVGEDAANAYTATATIKDAQFNAVPDALVSFGIDPTGPEYTPQASCVTDGNGVCSVDLTSTKSGTFTASASIVAGGITNSTTGKLTASVAWKADAVCSQATGCDPVDPGTPDEQRTRVLVTQDNQTADGYARDIVTVWAFDKWGNPVDGALVQSTTGDTDLRVQTGISPIGADGSSTVWYTTKIAGTHTADVSVDGVTPVGSPVDLRFHAGSVCVVEAGCAPNVSDKLTHVEVTTDNQPVDAGPNMVTAYAYDKDGNSVDDVSFDFAKLEAADDLVIDPSCVTGEDGTCEVQARAQAATIHQASASIGGTELTDHGSPVTITFAPGGVCVVETGCVPIGPGTEIDKQTHAVVTTNDQPVLGQDIVTVYAFDVYGNPVDEVAFVVSAPNPNLILGRNRGREAVVTSDEEGTGELATTSFQGGAYPAIVRVDGVELLGHGSPLELRFLDSPVIASPADGSLTKDHPVAVVGLGQNPSDTIIVTEGGSQVCTGVVTDNRTWSCRADLPDGSHTLTAVEVTSENTTSKPSDPVTFTVDTTPPLPPEITSPTEGTDTNDPSPMITGTGEEKGNLITVTDKGKTVCTAEVLDDKTWACTPEIPFIDGGHTLTATETDEAGNISEPSKPVTITVDTQKPSPPVVDPSTGATITGVTDPETVVTVTGPGGEVIEGCEAITPDEYGRFACTPPTPVEPGDKVEVVATDKAGNVSEPTRVTVRAIMVDLAYPTRHPGENQTATGRFFLPDERACLFLDNGSQVECRITGLDGTVNFSFPAPATTGAHTVTLTGELSGTVWTTFDTIIEVKTGGTVLHPRTSVASLVLTTAGFVLGLG